MATYKGIQGYTVQKLSTDPTAADTVGQLWYNSTSGKFKIATAGAGAWATGGALSAPTHRNAGAGTLTAGLQWGNYPGAAPAGTVAETYDGTSWTAVSSLNTGRQGSMGFGIQTAAICVGGGAGDPATPAVNCESYNGSTWTEVGNIPTERRSGMGAGITTAGLCATGFSPVGSNSTTTTEWNGSSWAAGNATNTPHPYPGGGGIQTAAFVAGGSSTADAEIYDGTSWTEVNNINTIREGISGAGTTTASVIFGGTPAITSTEIYDGSTWVAAGALSTGRGTSAGFGTQAAAVCAGGTIPPVALTEEWSDPVYTIKTVTVS